MIKTLPYHVVHYICVITSMPNKGITQNGNYELMNYNKHNNFIYLHLSYCTLLYISTLQSYRIYPSIHGTLQIQYIDCTYYPEMR